MIESPKTKVKFRHTKRKRTPVEPFDTQLEKARLREMPTKVETGFIRKEKPKQPSRYDTISEGGE